MKFLRKIGLSAALLLCILSLVVAGCSGGSDKGNNNPGTTNAPQTEQPGNDADNKQPELEPYTITWFVPGAAAQEDQELVNAEVSKYLKDKINASFKLEVIDWGSWGDKMNLKFASSEPFDLLYTTSWDGFTTKIQTGNIIDLTDLIDEFAPDAKQIIEPALLEGSKFNGRNYGLPVNKEMANQHGVMLRKDLVDKYNIDISQIKTLEDLEPIYDNILANEPGVTPFYLNRDVSLVNVYNTNNFDHFGGGGGTLAKGSTDYKLINGYDTPETKAGFDLARKWFLKGYINKDAATLQDLNGGLKAGKAFSYPDMLKPGKDAEVSTATGVDWVQVPLTPPIISTSDTLGSMASISRTSKDPERAMMFLNLLYTDPYLVNLIAFGIEGVHYVKVDDNTITFPEGVTAQTSGYNLNQAWLFGNQFLNYLWTNEDPQKWEKFKTFNDEAQPSPLLGFIFDPEKVKNEVAAISNVGKEFNPGLITGTVDPDIYLPQFIEKLKANGIDKVIAEQQAQLDEWLKVKNQ